MIGQPQLEAGRRARHDRVAAARDDRHRAGRQGRAGRPLAHVEAGVAAQQVGAAGGAQRRHVLGDDHWRAERGGAGKEAGQGAMLDALGSIVGIAGQAFGGGAFGGYGGFGGAQTPLNYGAPQYAGQLRPGYQAGV